jgi:hypothetical protein
MQKLLRIVSVIHWNFTGTDLKNGLGEPTALHQKDLLGGHHITSCPIQLYHKWSWIPAFFNLLFDRNFHYYLIIIQSRKWINQKGELRHKNLIEKN